MMSKMIFMILVIMMKILQTDGMRTTSAVSIILDGFPFQTWIEKSLWDKTCLSIVHHLNEFCKKDFHCEADYGIENIHLINAVRFGSTSVRLNITADEPVLPSNIKLEEEFSSYNYTALLTNALIQAKIDIEHLYDHRSLSSSTRSHLNSVTHRTSRLLFVFLGIVLVGLIFGLTVLFFQRIRRHSYSKLLKPIRTSQATQDELLAHSPSMSASHQ